MTDRPCSYVVRTSDAPFSEKFFRACQPVHADPNLLVVLKEPRRVEEIARTHAQSGIEIVAGFYR